MNAPDAGPRFGQSQAIAASSVHTAQCRAHQFRSSVRERPERHPARKTELRPTRRRYRAEAERQLLALSGCACPGGKGPPLLRGGH